VAELTFLFTDVVGSTTRWEANSETMAAELAAHDAAITAAVGAHGGTLLKTKGEGDSTVSVFAHAADALAAAAAAQRALTLPVRMAVHAGPAEARDGDYFGPTLNRAARLRAIAHAGQVLCSEAAAADAESALTDLSLVDVGVHRLKDLAAPEHVYQLAGGGLPADFPPLNSLNRATTNLPAQPSSFVGRAAELAHVRALIAESRLLTLIGTGGSGKTRLAVEAAAELFDGYPDGVWFCELAPISEDGAVANVVAAAANITLFPGDATPQVVAGLADKTTLVVLDNCEHVIEGAAAFAAALLAGAPKVRVIATSRERFRIAGESAWTVPPLALPDDDRLATTSEAVQLFFERALMVAPAFTIDDATTASVIDICRRVEAVPLAIELAAARVRVLNVHDLRSRLEQHWDILSGGGRDTLPHQRSLRATIDWSHSLLSPLAQRVLHQLAVFRGGFELAAAERVLVAGGVNEYDALDTIQDLLDKSLIGMDADTGRYRMLETVREYALEQLVTDGSHQTTQRHHARHLVEVLRDVEERLLQAKEQRNSLLLVAREHDNIIAALTWALENDHEIAGELVGYTFAPWYGLGQPAMATWYRRFLPYIDEIEGETLIRACIAVGTILGYLGDKDVAYPILERAVATARSSGDEERLALALALYASVLRIYEELDEALPLARESMSIPITSERQVIRALVSGWGAWVIFDTGHTQEGRDAIVEAHKLCLELDDHLILGSVLDSIGHCAPDYMSVDDALAALQRENAWLHGAGAVEATSGVVNDTRLFMREGRWSEALASVEHTLTLPLTHWRQEFFLNIHRAALLQLLDRCEEALALDEQLYREARTAVDRHHALCDVAIARRGVGDLDGAEQALDEALQYLLDGHNPTGGWGVCPTPTLFGWLLLFKATLLVERGAADTEEIARLLGIAEGLMAQSTFDISFEVARIRHGYEDRLPPPDPTAQALAATASLEDAVAAIYDPR
jgi:predicted ATPase